jgi:hypothetical protein
VVKIKRGRLVFNLFQNGIGKMKPHRDAIGKPIHKGRGKKDFLFFEGTKIRHSEQGSTPLVTEDSDLFSVFVGIRHELNCDS